VATPEWVRGIDHHDVYVARELEMLKPVVEQKPVDATICEFLTMREAVRTYSKGNAVSEARLH
jgi:hypothetical protein